jgi:hypothetical protein
MFIWLLTTLLLVESAYSQACDAQIGPSGTYVCALLAPYYTDYQWATCLTQAYITQLTKKVCINLTATYCWLQCMAEMHDDPVIINGTVREDCRCSPSQVLNTTSLPHSCYSPDGTDCGWYRNCLEKRYSCQGTTAGYAIRFAEKYCTLYTASYGLFTPSGRQWVNEVRKCLQVTLAPLLRPWNDLTCEQVQQFAFKSHAPCYLNPGNSAPSMCKLNCLEWDKIVWTIRGDFKEQGYIMESINEMINAALECPSSTFSCFYALNVIYPILPFKMVLQKGPKKTRAASGGNATENVPLASLLSNSISAAMQWDANVLDWIVYVDEAASASNSTHVIAVLWLMSRTEVNQSIAASESKILKGANTKLQDAFIMGNLKIGFSLDSMDLSCNTIYTCEDARCQKTTSEIQAPLSKSSRLSARVSVIFLYVIVLVKFIFSQ